MTIEYTNRLEDINDAIAVIDNRGPVSRKKVFWFLGCVMVLYWFIPPLLQDFRSPVNWVMALIAVGLTVYVWQGPTYFNKRFAKQYVGASPSGKADITDDGILIEDGCGNTTLLYKNGIAVYEYKDVLAINAGRQRIAAVPLRDVSEEQRGELRGYLAERLGTRFERVERLSTSGGGGFLQMFGRS